MWCLYPKKEKGWERQHSSECDPNMGSFRTNSEGKKKLLNKEVTRKCHKLHQGFVRRTFCQTKSFS